MGDSRCLGGWWVGWGYLGEGAAGGRGGGGGQTRGKYGGRFKLPLKNTGLARVCIVSNMPKKSMVRNGNACHASNIKYLAKLQPSFEPSVFQYQLQSQ